MYICSCKKRRQWSSNARPISTVVRLIGIRIAIDVIEVEVTTQWTGEVEARLISGLVIFGQVLWCLGKRLGLVLHSM
jgi:hypothetical protein